MLHQEVAEAKLIVQGRRPRTRRACGQWMRDGGFQVEIR